MTCTSENGEHHITIPQHGSLRIGTLNNILADVASYLKKEKADVVDEVFAAKR